MRWRPTKVADPAGKRRLPRLLLRLPALLGIALLLGAVYVVLHQYHNLRLHDVRLALDGIPRRALVVAFLCTIAAYFVLTLYDWLGTVYAGHWLAYRRVAFASFCAYTLSHNLGFPAVSGAAVRYRLYAAWGLKPLEIAKVVAFCSLTFGLGGMVLGGTILFLEPGAVPFFGDWLPHWAMYLAGAALWAVMGAYLVLAGRIGQVRLFGHLVELPGLKMALLQVLLAAVDVAVTAAIFYVLLPPVPGLPYHRFLAIYLASYAAGLAANLPGGIGVFDSAMLLGLGGLVAAPEVVGAIVVFRLFYYIIPLFIAGALFTGNELVLRSGDWLHAEGSLGARLGRISRALAVWSEPDFAIGAATGVVVLCGALLLGLGVLRQPPDISWIDPDFGAVARNAGQFVPSLIGAGLIVLAIGMSQRVTLAWGSTLVLLILGAAVTAAQRQDVWIPVVLILSALLVAPFRVTFYRRARLLSGKLTPASAGLLLALIVCVLALAVFDERAHSLAGGSWWQVVLSPGVPNSLRATVALCVAVGLWAIWRLLRPGRVTWLPWSSETRSRFARLGGVPPAVADGLVLGEAGRAGLAFRRVEGLLIGLGEPVGAYSDRSAAIWRLRDLAQQEGRNPAIWRAGPGVRKVCADLGLTGLPLDADGLPTETDAEPATRYLYCRVERDLPRLLPLLPVLSASDIAKGTATHGAQ